LINKRYDNQESIAVARDFVAPAGRQRSWIPDGAIAWRSAMFFVKFDYSKGVKRNEKE